MLPLTGSDVATKIDDLIGNTPMLRLALDGLPSTTTLLAKLEAANPLSSIKDRVALRMVEEAGRPVS